MSTVKCGKVLGVTSLTEFAHVVRDLVQVLVVLRIGVSFEHRGVFILGAALALTAIASVWLLCPDIKQLKPHSA